MRRLCWIGIGLMVALALAGCSTSRSSANPSANLTGLWQLTMPDHSQLMFRITSVGGERFRIWKSDSALNGTYERRGNRLVMVLPADQRMTEFVWRIDDDRQLTLIKEPATSQTSRRYRNATLKKTS